MQNRTNAAAGVGGCQTPTAADATVLIQQHCPSIALPVRPQLHAASNKIKINLIGPPAILAKAE